MGDVEANAPDRPQRRRRQGKKSASAAITDDGDEEEEGKSSGLEISGLDSYELMAKMLDSFAKEFTKMTVSRMKKSDQPSDTDSDQESPWRRVKTPHAPRETDLRRELEKCDLPKYDGNYKYLRANIQQILSKWLG